MSILVDTNLLLRMAHKIAKILSFNHQDFQRYQEVAALAPNDVVKSAP